MEKPYILIKEEMKKDVSEAVSKYINSCMASDIADHLNKVASELNQLAEKQIEQARKQYEEAVESEVSENG